MKIVKERNATVWCEVICNKCGAAVGKVYYTAKTIKAIQAATKDWKTVTLENGDVFQLCPECIKTLKEA